jgi:hypothetical protein
MKKKVDVKKFLFKLLDVSIGKAIRTFDVFLQSGRTPNRKTVLAGIHDYAITSSVEFAASHMNSALIFPTKQALWDYAYKMSPLGQMEPQTQPSEREFIGLEFGVFKGSSISYFANMNSKISWFGFDSFIGLEEDWPGTALEKGHFSLSGSLPSVPKNVTLVPGWFKDTLLDFIARNKEQWQVAFLHLDADTYTPTMLALESLNDHFADGAVIVFDEFFGYPGWQQHESRAWLEFVEMNSRKFEYIAMSEQNIAIRLI